MHKIVGRTIKLRKNGPIVVAAMYDNWCKSLILDWATVTLQEVETNETGHTLIWSGLITTLTARFSVTEMAETDPRVVCYMWS